MAYHVLSKNTKTTIPNLNIFFDTETNLCKLKNGNILMPLRLGHAIFRTFHGESKVDKRESYSFTRPQDFYNFVMSHIHDKERLCLYAHNIAFDLGTTMFYYQAFKDGWSSRMPYTAGGVFIDRITKGKMSIDLIDTYNFFKCSLAKLGQAFDLPKLDIDFDSDKYIPTDELKVYCQRDTEILETVVSFWYDFLRTHDLGHAQRTIASQALAAYRHRFMAGSIKIDCKGQPKELERAAYYGGRVECFYIGKVPAPKIYKLDINSQYPYVMHNNPFPVNYAFKEKGRSIDFVKSKFKKYLCVAQCLVDTNERVYPKHIDGKLCFPTGKFWATLSTPEIKYAMKHNQLLKIDNIAYYRAANIFNKYVDFMYNERLKVKAEGNKPKDLMFKYLLNALYGKFGQKKRVTTEMNIDDLLKVCKRIEIDFKTGKYFTYLTFGGREIKMSTEDEDSYNAFCAIAAHVTAYARMYLYQLIKQAGVDHCFYCDTDSIFTDKTGYDRLQDRLSNSELGMLKLEETSDHVIIRGNKDYIFGDTTKLKGVTKKAKKLSSTEYEYFEWSSFKSVFSRGLRRMPIQKLKRKVLSLKYTKGILQPDGRVAPFILNEA